MILDEDIYYCPFLEGGRSWLPCTDDPDLPCQECSIFRLVN